MEDITENNPTLANRRADLKAFISHGSFLSWFVFFFPPNRVFYFHSLSSHGEESPVTFKQFKNS